MKTTSATPHTRVSALDRLGERGIWLEFYDPTGSRYGLPTYPYRWAPLGLLTRRQLRAQGLRPGGQPIAAQILWRRGKRVAYLYRTDLAKPKRAATVNQLAAIGKALRARRICGLCQVEQTYTIPTSLGCCLTCHDEGA
jgi:hypothetical protein